MRPTRALLAIALLLAACQAPAPAGPRPAASAAPRKGASAAPAATPSAAATRAAATSGPALLVRPADAGAGLRGQVRLDATYMVSTGAGGLIGADGATLQGSAGASAVAVAKSPLVAAGAGNAIAGRLGADGASLVGADGGTLIGADGASLVGADGGTLIGADAGTYTLAQATAEAPAVNARQLPAAGMAVAAFSLATGKPVPVGRDAAGEPVYAVYTDAAGRYAIFPPAAERGNLRVAALAPGTPDARLRYGVYARGEGARDVSEASSIAASYVYRCVIKVFDAFMRKRLESRLETLAHQAVSMGLATPETDALARIERIAAEIGYEDWPEEADREALARRVAEIGLSLVDLGALETIDGKPAMPVLEELLALGEADVATMMAAPPAGETATTMFDDVPSLGGFKILRPADWNLFVVEKIVLPDPLDSARIGERTALARVEMNLPARPERIDAMNAACYGISNGIGERMFQPDADGKLSTLDAVEAAMRAFVPSRR